MRLTEEYMDMLVSVSDADGVISMLRDFGYDEEADYVQDKYFKS